MNQNFKTMGGILISLALFLGATVQYSEGSHATGFILFLGSLLLLLRLKHSFSMKEAKKYTQAHNKWWMSAGALIIFADLFYNYQVGGRSGINTLDTMTLLLGASLIMHSFRNQDLRGLGSFGAVLSATFISLFLVFYVGLNQQLYKFDHYFVMLPSAYLSKFLGLPIQIVGVEMIKIGAADDLIVKIGGPCSGLYSMFLLIGVVTGFSVTEGVKNAKSIIAGILVAAGVAYAGNLIRVSTIFAVGYMYGAEWMMDVHVHLGWMIFALTSLVMLFYVEKAGMFLRKGGFPG